MAKKIETDELKLTRIYDAPVKLVWDAWNDPEQVAKWWGPRGFTITHHSKDLRAGGHWKYTMHGPDGTDFPNWTIYHEVEKYKKLVYDHGGSETTPPLFRVTALFIDLGGKTKLDMTMKFESVERAKEIAKFIKKAGGTATWDRLAEYLSDQEGGHRFYINRSFDAPMATVFKMWTDPKHIAQWMPPEGLMMECLKSDVKVGGRILFKMTDGKSMTMYGSNNYLEITPVTKLVYVQDFRDENDKPSRHPLAPVWPSQMLANVTFTDEGSDQTRVTVQFEPYGVCTQEEIATFVSARGGMTQGWTESFDKLEELLPKN